jgi:hypothetical protein
MLTSLASLLLFDVSTLSIFSRAETKEISTSPPISDVTINSFNALLEKQTEKIHEQDQQCWKYPSRSYQLVFSC